MQFDVIIVGSGPVGSTAAMYLAKSLGKEKVLLVDKANFPRDKICGDAQGRKASTLLKELGIDDEFRRLPGQKIYGITLSSPDGSVVHLDVEDRKNPAPGFVHRRMIFDDFMSSHAKKAVTFKLFTVTDLIIENNMVKGVVGTNEHGQKEEIRSKLVLAADGANSIVAQKFGLNKNPLEHFIVATRQYYKGVTGMTDRIEIHMIEGLIPGYFWIFPVGNGEANIGLGMITKDMQEKKVNLREATLRTIKENPLFKERFKNAVALEDVKAWNLPIASHHRKCYGNGFLLLGDAASLIDPLSGEGVGNGMISGKIAAEIAVKALQKNDFSEKFLQLYDKMLWNAIGPEVKSNYKLQRLGTKFPFLLDKLVARANKDESFRKRVESLLPFTGGRTEIGTPGFVELLSPGHREALQMASED